MIESLPRGRWLAWPLADPKLAELGRPEDDPLLIMSLALPEHLATLDGSEIAAFATPPDTRLGTTAVTLPRALPRRLARHFPPIRALMPWIVTPYGRDLWLHIPPLKLTLRVDDERELDTLVRSEVERVVTATEPPPDDLLRLMPALGYRLGWVDVELLRADRATSTRSAAARAIAAEEANRLMLDVASPLHADPRITTGPPLVARPDELATLDRLLDKESVLVHGPELAGKTALIEGWIRARLSGPEPRDPRALPPLFVYATSGARLMAGMSLLGQWQARLARVLQAAATLRAVLWVEHLGELLGEAGQGEELANALRPWLEDGRVRLVTELRDEEIDRLQRRYPALFAALRRVRVAPLSKTDTLAVLDARHRHLAEHEPGRARLAPDALPELVALAGRYQSHLANPGAPVRLGDDLLALAETDRTPEGRAALVDAPHAQRLYARLSGLPLWLLDDRRPFDVAATTATLAAQVVAQGDAVAAVAESLAVIKTRLAARNKPLASFLFAGPTGVGKTELARALAMLLFGSEARLIRFDMSEFTDPTAAERLIRGGDGLRDGLLTRRLRKEPLSVVLLDEIEKAHRSVFDLLLQALGEGRLTDARGKTASLEGAIVILTSNLGAGDKVRRIGLAETDESTLAAHYLAAVRRHFAPELVNRLDKVIPFSSLGPDALRRIVRLQLARLTTRRGLARIGLEVADAALDHIAAAGTTAAYGARALRRALERLLTTPLAHLVASRPAHSIAAVTVDLAQCAPPSLSFVVHDAPRPTTHARGPLATIARMRREARAHLQSSAVREVVERIEQLEADLLRGAPAGPLLAERARLDTLLAPFREVAADLEELEDLAHLTSSSSSNERLATREPLDNEIAWAEARLDELGAASFELLTAIEERRDHALVALTELDDGRAFDRWLLPLIEHAEARRWTLTAWIEGEHAERWPRHLGLGPPRPADDLYIRIASRPTDFRHLVLGVAGRHAGTLLACEDGLVAVRPGDADPAHLLVRALSCASATLTPEAIADSELLAAPPSETRGPLAHGTPHRIFLSDPPRMTLRHHGGTSEEPGDVHRFFATWERHAARRLRALDDDPTRDRSELFESPLDVELTLKRLMREAAAERPSWDRP